MRRSIFLAIATTMLAGCMTLFPSAPPRFPQFNEHAITGSGRYTLPQWSPDGRYIAFLDLALPHPLTVYDTESARSWTAAVNARSLSWKPDGRLTYLRYRPDLSGSPRPRIMDLHQVDVNGENNVILKSNIIDPADFIWLNDNEHILILLDTPENSYYNDVYILNVISGKITLLVEAEELGLSKISGLDLAADENSLLFFGTYRESQTSTEISTAFVIYDLETMSIQDRINPDEVIPNNGEPLYTPNVERFHWINDGWILIKTSSGECHYHALFFFDRYTPSNSFCIPSSNGAIISPELSPDSTQITYINIAGIGNDYIMIGNLTTDILDKISLEPNQTESE